MDTDEALCVRVFRLKIPKTTGGMQRLLMKTQTKKDKIGERMVKN